MSTVLVRDFSHGILFVYIEAVSAHQVMLPIVTSEDSVTLFKYWQKDIRTGMFYRNELYMRLRTYDIERRLDADKDGNRLSGTGWQVCITIAPSGYTLWKSLRALPRKVNQNGLTGNILAP